MRRNKRKQNNIIIAGLLCVVLLMVAGYAAFASKLNISGTSNITSNWDVEITAITKDKTSGNVTEISTPSYTKDSASFNVGLESPGNYIYYKIAVTNKGSLAAMAKIGSLKCGDGSVIQCGAYPDSSVSTNIGSETDLENSRLIIASGETEYYNLYVKYNNDVTTQPDITNQSINLTLTYTQSDVGITHKTEDNCYTGKVLKDGTMSITNYNEECGTDVVIPETIDGYMVTEIADGTYDDNLGTVGPFSKKGITSVIMPNTITYIGMFAFRDNTIKTLKLSENLVTINSEAFGFNQISEVLFYDKLAYIGYSAFCSNQIKEISLPQNLQTLGDGAFSNNMVEGENAFIYYITNGVVDRSILNSYAGASVDNVTIPSNVKTIKKAAFRFMRGNNLIIPSTVETLDKQSLWQCYARNITLENGLKTIGESAFSSVVNINSIEIPDSVETIGKLAFAKSYLVQVTIGKNIQTIGTDAFKTVGNYNPITSITINKKEGSISGSPWGASGATINWTGTN